MPDPRGHGWWPYLGPYGAFLLLVEVSAHLPPGAQFGALVAKALVPAGLLVHFWRRGAYAELRGYRFDAGTLADIAVGVGIAVFWVAPFALWPELERGAVFEPGTPGTGAFAATLAVRALGFAVVTPFVEELFVRSFLHRYLDVWQGRGHFLDRPMATYTPRAFWGTVLWFIFSHAMWEWGVAAMAGVVFNLWLYRRGHLGAVVIAHAAANGSIWLWVVYGPGGFWAFL